MTLDPSEWPHWGRVTLKPLLHLDASEWRQLHSFFRDRELADWNGAQPIRLPEFLFRRVMLDEERSGERHGFGILDEAGAFIGSVELYDLRPTPPQPSRFATLGVMIGQRALWGQGYGREALRALIVWSFEERTPPLSRLRLTTFSHNHRAQRAFAACGFREVGRTEEQDRTDVHMELSREGWLVGRSDVTDWGADSGEE